MWYDGTTHGHMRRPRRGVASSSSVTTAASTGMSHSRPYSGLRHAVSRRAIGTSLVATIRARALSPSGVSHGVVRPPPAPGRTPQASRNGPDIAVTRQPKILVNLGQRDKRNDLYRFGGSKLIRF